MSRGLGLRFARPPRTTEGFDPARRGRLSQRTRQSEVEASREVHRRFVRLVEHLELEAPERVGRERRAGVVRRAFDEAAQRLDRVRGVPGVAGDVDERPELVGVVGAACDCRDASGTERLEGFVVARVG